MADSRIIQRRYARRDDIGFLIVTPIVIDGDEPAIAVMQFQDWIA